MVKGIYCLALFLVAHVGLFLPTFQTTPKGDEFADVRAITINHAGEFIGGQRISYPELNRVTKIGVRTYENELIKEITNPDQISKVLSFINQRRVGWKAPWYGVPVPNIRAEFYDRAEFKGHFGVGSGFFSVQRGDGFDTKTEEVDDGFFSKSASRKETDEFISLIEIPSNLVYSPPRPKAKKADSPIEVPANREWTAFDLVKRGERIQITATGEIQLNSSGLTSGPQGVDTQKARRLMPDKPTGALIAVISANQENLIFIGSTTEFIAQNTGVLLFGVNDRDFSDNSGSYQVTIKISKTK